MKKSHFCKKPNEFSLRIALVILAVTSFFSGCEFLNEPVKEYFKEYTETAAIVSENYTVQFPRDNTGTMSIPSTGDNNILYYLRNPQKYNLNFSYVFNSAEAATKAASIPNAVEFRKTSDTSAVTMHFSNAFLKKMDGGKDISGKITITEPNTGRSFDPYEMHLKANSPPPEVKGAMLMKTSGNQYVLCFYLPDLTDTVHEFDTSHISINDKIWFFDYSGINGNPAFTPSQDLTLSSEQLFPLTATSPTFNANAPNGYFSVYCMTHTDVSDSESIFVTKLIDDAGFESSVPISNKAKKLDAAGLSFSALDGSTIYADDDTGYARLTISHNGLCTDGTYSGTPTLTYYVLDPSGNKIPALSDTATGTAVLNLPPLASKTDKYQVHAIASYPYYIDSDDVPYIDSDDVSSVNPGDSHPSYIEVNVSKSFNYYVSSSGDDTNGDGTKTNPFASMSKAYSMAESRIRVGETGDPKILLMSDISAAASESIYFTNDVTVAPYGASTRTITLSENRTAPLFKVKSSKLTLSNIVIDGSSNSVSGSILSTHSTDSSIELGNTTIKNADISSTTEAALYIEEGKITMTDSVITGITNTSNQPSSASAVKIPSSGIFVFKNSSITNCNVTYANSDSTAGAIRLDGPMYINGKCIITGNKDSSGNEANVIYGTSDSEIKVLGALTGSTIGVTPLSLPVTAADKKNFTSGYGYQTGGRNPALFPGKVFRHDAISGTPYTVIGNSADGEAALAVGGGSLSIDAGDGVTLTADSASVTRGGSVTLSATGVPAGATASWSYTLKCHGDTVPAAKYTTSGTTVTFTSVMADAYVLIAELTVGGKKYTASFNITVNQ